MLFGVCASMLPGFGPRGVGEIARGLKALGFDYVELPVMNLMELEDRQFFELVEQPLKESGLPCPRMNSFLPAFQRLTGPEARLDEAMAFARLAFARAERLGARVIVFGSGGARNRPLGFPREQGFVQLADFLRNIAPLAAGHGISLAVEHLNRLESNLINSYREACALAEAAGQDNVGPLLDSYHLGLSNEPLEEIKACGRPPLHAHTARTLGRGMPCPGDEEDYGLLLRTLRAAGYDGTLSVEGYARADWREEAALALRTLRAAL